MLEPELSLCINLSSKLLSIETPNLLIVLFNLVNLKILLHNYL